MAIAKIDKLQIIGHLYQKDEVIKELQKLGLVEIIEIKEKPLGRVTPLYSSEELEGVLERIQEAIDYILGFQKKGFWGGLAGQDFGTSQKEIETEGFDYEKRLQELGLIRARIKQLTEDKQRLHLEHYLLLPWKRLELSLEEPHSTKQTRPSLGRLLNQDFSLLVSELEKEGLKYYLEVVKEDNFQKHLFLICLKIDSDKIDTILKKHNFHFLRVPYRKGKVSEALEEIAGRISQVTRQIQELEKSLQDFLPDKVKLMAVYDYLMNLRERQVIQKRFTSTQQSFIIEGWIRKKDLEVLTQRLILRFKELDIFSLKPRPEEVPPVILENKRLIRPFEAVTELYGQPQYGKTDPTSYLAPFFVLSFGLCLTDAGYGLVLAVASFFILKKISLARQARQLINLFLWGGLFTVFAGAVTGSWFGNLIDRLPANFLLIKKFKDSLLLLDPLKSPLSFLVLTLALGFVQVFCGVLIKLIEKMKEKDWEGVFFSELPTLTTQGSLLLLFLVFIGLLKSSFLGFLWALLLISALLIVIHQCRVNKDWGLKVFWSIFGLYQIITGNFLADTLSFSRIFALGLTTGLLAMAVNEVSFLVPSLLHSLGVPFLIGTFIAGVVFIVGHIANLAINLLGAYVHTSRLQYLEFFTKFFEGGGRVFRPFKIEHRYLQM